MTAMQTRFYKLLFFLGSCFVPYYTDKLLPCVFVSSLPSFLCWIISRSHFMTDLLEIRLGTSLCFINLMLEATPFKGLFLIRLDLALL